MPSMTIKEIDVATGHEKVVRFEDHDTGLRAFIGVHSTRLGASLGGCRFWNYNSEDEALTDVLRLSRGMTYKNAVAGLPLGGGKSVLMASDAVMEGPARAAMFESFGRAVETLRGSYVTAEDVGTRESDMEAIARATTHVCGLPAAKEKVGGNPSPITAHGIFCGIRATAKHALGTDDLKGVRVAMQGLGNVGYALARELHEAGAKLIVTDINKQAVDSAAEEFGAKPVALEDIYAQEAEIFSPCALGATLSDATIPLLKAKAVAGGANNQLAQEDRHDTMLADRNILYAPDYVINAGGVIFVAAEYLKETNRQAVIDRVEQIEMTLDQVYTMAKRSGLTPNQASTQLADDILARGKPAYDGSAKPLKNCG